MQGKVLQLASGGGRGVPRPDWYRESELDSVLARGAGALWHDGDLGRARRLFDAAFRLAEQQADGEAMARSVLGLAGLRVDEHRTVTSAAILSDRLRRALRAVPPSSSLALRLRVRIAAEHDYRNGQHETLSAVTEEARHAGDPVALADALSLLHHCLLGPEHAAPRLHIADELIAESVRTQRRSDLLMGVLWRTVDMIVAGHPHADRHLAELRGLLRRADHNAVGYVIDAIDVMLHVRAGHFHEAESRATHCRQRGSVVGDADASGWYVAHMVVIRWFQGRLGELVPTLGELLASPEHSVVDSSSLAALAVAYASIGDRRQAMSALRRIGGGSLSATMRTGSWLGMLYCVTEAAYLLEDQALASQAYQLLEPYAQLPAIVGLGVACFGSVHHALGVAALTMSSIEAGIAHLRAAVADNAAMENWPAATLSRYRLSIALQRSGNAEDHAQSAREREVALREASEHGMQLPQPSHPNDTTADPTPEPEEVTCVPQGRQWRVRFGGRSVYVQHCAGLAYLATLFANPGHDIGAVELATGTVAEATTLRRQYYSPQPVLDQHALQAYRQRLDALDAEIDRCDAIGDQARAIEVHQERDWLLTEIQSASGLANRIRTFSTADERARVAVTKAIRRGLARIAAADQTMGAQLAARIRTGYRCVYLPATALDHG